MRKMLFITIILSFIFIECSLNIPSRNQNQIISGEMILNFDCSILEDRTIIPSIDINAAAYDVTGAGPGSAAFSELGVTSSTLTVTYLEVGSWTITVEAKNLDGTLIGIGSTNVEIEVGNIVNTTIEVTPLDGTGTLSLTVDWTDATQFTSAATVTGTLESALGSTESISFTKSEKIATHTSEIDTGYYTLSILVHEDSEDSYFAETLRIIYNEITSEIIEIPDSPQLFPEINVKRGPTNINSGSGSYNFGNVDIDSSSSAVIFTIENLGDAVLNLTGSPEKVQISGSNSSMFTVNTQPSSPVPPSSSTTFSIIFTPTSEGYKTANVSIPNDDTDENPYTFTITGTGILVSPESVLDDFNDGNSTNNWGHPTFSGGSGICNMSFVSDAYEGAKCLKLDYNVNTTSSYSYYVTKLGNEDLTINNYNAISFWIKGESGGEYFKIELKTSSGNPAGRENAPLYITDHLDGGVSTSWQKVTIPLKNFANIINFTDMNEMLFIFEEYQSGLNGSPKNGTVYIDYIEFESVSGGFDVIRIDHFGDKILYNALGGQMQIAWESSQGQNSYSIESGGVFHDYEYGLKYNYDVSASSGNFWSILYILFGGGSNGWQAQECDFGEYTKLTFWIKAESDNENPESIKIELEDKYGKKEQSIYSITTTWKKYELWLNSFNDGYNTLDKTSIKKLIFVLEQEQASDDLGAIYIDEIQFEK